MKRFAIVAFTVLLASSSASAQVLLSDNFNNENGGVSQLNYNAFSNWNVTGQVDYLHNYPGLTCAGGSAGCVDLDGSPGPGALTTKQVFGFASGDQIKISFDLSGNQRNSDADFILLNLTFGGTTNLSGYTGSGGFILAQSGAFSAAVLGIGSSIVGTAGFSNWSFLFTAAQAGTVQYRIGTNSADNIGPILDNVVVERVITSTVPEPSTYAMMALGMLVLGGVARGRRASRG